MFKKTFDYLADTLGKESFKKYNVDKYNFEGPFSPTSYELITSGLAKNIDKISKKSKEDFKKDIIKMYTDERYINAAKRGVKAINRFKELTKFSEEYFTNEI